MSEIKKNVYSIKIVNTFTKNLILVDFNYNFCVICELSFIELNFTFASAVCCGYVTYWPSDAETSIGCSEGSDSAISNKSY